VVLQPAYLPWRGFFDQMRRADVFVYYDDGTTSTDGAIASGSRRDMAKLLRGFR
jgi:hypothetical protein